MQTPNELRSEQGPLGNATVVSEQKHLSNAAVAASSAQLRGKECAGANPRGKECAPLSLSARKACQLKW